MYSQTVNKKVLVPVLQCLPCTALRFMYSALIVNAFWCVSNLVVSWCHFPLTLVTYHINHNWTQLQFQRAMAGVGTLHILDHNKAADCTNWCGLLSSSFSHSCQCACYRILVTARITVWRMTWCALSCTLWAQCVPA